MPLKITLKPRESIHIGQSTITIVSDQISTLLIDGQAPVLRPEHFISPQAAHTPLQKLHLVLQRMYLGDAIELHHGEYFALAAKVMAQSPAMADRICAIHQLLLDGQVYEAVKQVSRMPCDVAEALGEDEFKRFRR